MKKTVNKESGLNPLLLFWPLIFVPITLYLVKYFGNIAGTAVLGILFFYLAGFKADKKTRRLMIVLATLSMIFETANVAAGFYSYVGTLGSPVWIPLGWAIFGWWAVQLTPVLSRLSMRDSFAMLSAAFIVFPFINHSLSIASLIAIGGIYIVSIASTQPVGLYVFSSLFAMLTEFSGTTSGVWRYFDPTGNTLSIVPPDLASLALSYSVVLAVCLWISGFEGVKEGK